MELPTVKMRVVNVVNSKDIAAAISSDAADSILLRAMKRRIEFEREVIREAFPESEELKRTLAKARERVRNRWPK